MKTQNLIPVLVGLVLSLSACSHRGKSFDDMDISFNDKSDFDTKASDIPAEPAENTSSNTNVDSELADYLKQAESKPSENKAPAELPPSSVGDTSLNLVPESEPISAAAGTDVALQIPPSEPLLPDASATATPPLPELNPAPALANPAAAATTAEVAPTPHKKSPSSAPKLPSQVVHRKGQALNRFYFLRKGDTPESLSRLFYGEAGHEDELLQWNGKLSSWKPGKLVLFVSAWQPEDTAFVSFFEEQGIEGETYTIQQGDQLKSLAQEKYGDVRSWKEIALLNHLPNVKAVKKGTQIKLYPENPQAMKIRETVEAKFSSLDKAEASPARKPATDAITLPPPPSEGAPVGARVSEMRRGKGSRIAAARLPENKYFSYTLWAFILSSALCLILVWLHYKSKEDAEFLD